MIATVDAKNLSDRCVCLSLRSLSLRSRESGLHISDHYDRLTFFQRSWRSYGNQAYEVLKTVIYLNLARATQFFVRRQIAECCFIGLAKVTRFVGVIFFFGVIYFFQMFSTKYRFKKSIF